MVSAQDVLDYLKQNPSFFKENEEILVDLKFIGSGDMAPFVERRIEVLKSRENQQKAKLDLIVDSARNNLKLEDSFLEMSVRLLSEGQSGQDELTVASAMLVKQFNITKAVFLLNTDDIDSRHPKYDEIRQRVAHKSSICDDRVSSSLLRLLFETHGDEIQSCAFVPLVFDDILTGVLVLGSSSEDRFAPGMGAIFLDKLGLLMASYLKGRMV
jgi:uncharacterized protein YigA (DUF484 family)